MRVSRSSNRMTGSAHPPRLKTQFQYSGAHHLLPELDVHLIGDAPRHRHRGDTPRLRACDTLVLPIGSAGAIPCIHQELSDLRRLSRPRLTNEHHDLVVVDNLGELVLELVYRELELRFVENAGGGFRVEDLGPSARVACWAGEACACVCSHVCKSIHVCVRVHQDDIGKAILILLLLLLLLLDNTQENNEQTSCGRAAASRE
jgi:hypothetical protein